jgi:GNAT superfamily N-acetyltransferase
MFVDMASYGGHAVNDSPDVWSAMVERVQANIVRNEHLYLLASIGAPTRTTVGMAAAYLEPLEDIFVAKTRLHLSAVYTVPSSRRQDVARELIRKVLEWGRQMHASEAELSVLVANPARRLYEHLGFQIHEMSMVKTLGYDQPADP